MTKTQRIVIPNAPQFPGLAFRGFRGEPDFPAMAEIITAANQADKDDEAISAEDIAINYSHIQRSDPEKDMVFIEIDGNPVGYGRCLWDQESEGDYLYTFFLHLAPQGRRIGIERPVVDYFLQRLLKTSYQHPASATKYFQTWGSVTKPDWNQLIEEMGFEAVRYTIGMVRPCDQSLEVTDLPEGIEVRPVQKDHMRKIFDAENEAFLDHWGSINPTETDYQRWSEEPLHDPKLWKVAWDGDEVVGMVRNYINHKENETFARQRGYTEEISVRRPWRRKGVARALLTQSIQMFIEMGMEDTSLGVDTENPSGAFKLYTDVGYTEIRRFITYRKPVEN